MLVRFDKLYDTSYFKYKGSIYRKQSFWCPLIDKYATHSDSIDSGMLSGQQVTLLVDEPIIFGELFADYTITKYFDEYGKLHRTSGPASIYTTGDQFWYKHGKYHRLDGPAKVWQSGTEEYYIDGLYYNSYLEYLVALEQYKNTTLTTA